MASHTAKLIDFVLGIAFCCVVSYYLNIYIAWAPPLDIFLFVIIVVLNSAQLAL